MFINIDNLSLYIFLILAFFIFFIFLFYLNLFDRSSPGWPQSLDPCTTYYHWNYRCGYSCLAPYLFL